MTTSGGLTLSRLRRDDGSKARRVRASVADSVQTRRTALTPTLSRKRERGADRRGNSHSATPLVGLPRLVYLAHNKHPEWE